MKNNKILIVSGLIDFQVKGNQTIKQTVKYFAQNNSVIMISFIPKTYKNLDVNFESKNNNLIVKRQPLLFSLFFKIILVLKNTYKTKNVSNADSFRVGFSDKVDYFDNTSRISMFIYHISLYAYFLSEFPRVFVSAIINRPNFIYGYENYGALLGSIVGRILKIPVVKRFQGTPIFVEKGKIRNPEKLKHFILPYSINKYRDYVVMANDGTKGDLALSALGVPSENIFFPINGFVKENLSSAKKMNLHDRFNLDPEVKTITMLAKLKIWKRVDRGIFLLEKILNKHQSLKVHLVIIGDGEMLSTLRKIVINRGLEKNVTFAGALTHEDSLSIVNSCDMFWSFYDITNLGNPLLEAAYLEKPIVTTGDRDVNFLFGNRELCCLDEIDCIVDESYLGLIDDSYKESLIAYSCHLKNNLFSWKDRIKNELNWISTKINEDFK
jgi:hypothetical protein